MCAKICPRYQKRCLNIVILSHAVLYSCSHVLINQLNCCPFIIEAHHPKKLWTQHASLVEQVQALHAQLRRKPLRKPTILAFAVGGLPESKHLDEDCKAVTANKREKNYVAPMKTTVWYVVLAFTPSFYFLLLLHSFN
ncbi:hypothetical protein T4B_2301 [Trichinella pseudospiralis]|uniref:Uncharacterized protein n=1 Tax=Trichinella pseudospiralis TaxID=6337 RepID=A0A0V1J787_TRIPS|nr:hypothetical protein T4A_6456 [Trichinella pseudospiralis]KRZ30816.1 hypothetical protein T4B_2301 [Trichinella pseudospiralis]KRZ46087.1 hypothetical protein T4C_2728 [Trichinella pseudospiralis]